MTRRILAVLAAVLLALVGTTAVFAYVKGADRRALAGQDAGTVWIATKAVPVGTSLAGAVDAGLLREELVARKAVPAGALDDINEADGKLVAANDIAPGEIVLASRFAEEATATTAVAIPKGRMAVTVEIEDPQRVAPFLQAGDEIAVFTSYKVRRERSEDEPPSNGDECAPPEVCATRIVLTRVTVLGVGEATTTESTNDENSGEGADDAAPVSEETAALVTLALTQSQAEKVVHLSNFGNMHFALLNRDSDVTDTPGVSDLNFFQKRY